MQSELFKDIVEKKIGYSCSIHCFSARGKNYPLMKAMVDHNHDRIEAIDGGKVGNEVHGEVLKRAGAFKSKGGDGQDYRMGEYLVCLANSIPRDIFSNIDREAWPPVVLGEESNGPQVATMAAFKGAVGSSNQVMVDDLKNVKTGLIVKLSVIQDPIVGF